MEENQNLPPESPDSFSILIGGEIPEVEKSADSQKSFSMQNWLLCKFRTEPIPTVIQSCCAKSETVICTNCLKFGTKQLVPQICSDCNFMEPK